VPYVYTDVYIYTANPSFNSLNAVGGWAYVNGGVRGIIVYRRSNEEFVAFDRNCTFDPDKTCATLSVDKNNNILAADSCCGSKFNIYDGSVTRSPATRGLRQYNTYYNGSSLHITN
jgi:nitrite reductase/ring-hydroxylating ferredoxin subunit